MHHIFGAVIVAPYKSLVPCVYAIGAPTFTMPVVVNVLHEVNQYVEMENDARLKEDASTNANFMV